MKKILTWMVITMIVVSVWSLDVQACRKENFWYSPWKKHCVKPRCVFSEVLYLSDSAITGDGTTTLFRVNLDPILDPITNTKRANLVRLPDAGYGPGVIPVDQVDAIAVTPDGKRLYAIDKFNIMRHPGGGKLGYYDLLKAKWLEIGVVKTSGNTTPIPGIVLAVFSPNWTLYAASETTDSLYKIETASAEAILIGKIVNSETGVTVNVIGADIAFDINGTLYLWANRPNSSNPGGAPRGLYYLTLPESIPDTVYATYISKDLIDDEYYTGLTVRANGIGDLVASTHEDHILVVDKSNGNKVDTFDMYLDGIPYEYEYGDMSVGQLSHCNHTIGFWKNHSWCDASALICGVPVDETWGRYILWSACSKNFSMLFAQLIAAKLNTNNSSGIEIIEEAESWLCSQPGIKNGETLNWDKGFDSETQKDTASHYSSALDDFNNSYDCKLLNCTHDFNDHHKYK